MTFKERLIEACSLTKEERVGTNKLDSFIKEFISAFNEVWNNKFILKYSGIACRKYDEDYYVEKEIKISNHSGTYSDSISFLVPLRGFPCLFIDCQCEYVRCDTVEDIEIQLIEWIKKIKPILACVQD